MLLIRLFTLYCISVIVALRQISFHRQSLTPVSSNQYQFQTINTGGLIGQFFQGKFNSLQDQNLFNYLDVNSGVSRIYFVSDLLIPKNGLNQAFFYLFNPIYHDEKVIIIQMELPEFNQSISAWINDTAEVQVYQFYKQRQKSSFLCNTSFEITLNNVQSNIVKNYIISSKFNSNPSTDQRCSFNFQSQLTYYTDELKVLYYCLFVSGLIIFEMLCDYKIFKQIASGLIDVTKLSLATATFCNIQDLYFILTFVVHLMNQNKYYMFYILPITLFVLLTVVFDMRLVIIIWKNRNVNNDIPQNQLRRRLIAFYIIFYLGLILYATLMFLFPYQLGMHLLQGLFFIPQIIHNFRLGNNPNFYPYYIFGFLTIRRYLLPLYERGCPQNLFMVHPSKIFCILWTTIFLFQLLFLFMQYLKGPKFFVPKRFIAGYYQYRFKYKFSDNSQNECAICLELLSSDIKKGQHKTNKTLNHSITEQIFKEKIVMKAPCNHMFHQDCFLHWIDVKLECPICRMKLPAYIQ